MIYLDLFLTFLKIGAVAFGGGYGIISFIRDEVTARGWLGEGELLNIIAVSESTPGPIAVNAATFIGASRGGVLGAIVATLGVILPAFIIMLLIAAVIRNFLKYKGVQAVLSGIRPFVVGLIIGTAVIMFLGLIFGIKTVGDAPSFDIRALVIFVIVAAAAIVPKKVFKKRVSPILLILLSAGLGIAAYSI